MRRFALLPMAFLASIALNGCSATFTMKYTPVSTVRGPSIVAMGIVNYEPADTGQLRPNQIHNTAYLGSMYYYHRSQSRPKPPVEK